MITPRYSFAIAKFKGMVYALGGRGYNDNFDSIIGKCEKYDP
jgi:hypothetical protein